MLELQIERVLRTKHLDKLIIASSTEISDNPIKIMCQRLKINCFQGSLTNVLDRFYQAANQFRAETIIRITGDCPLFDPLVADRIIEYHIENDFDYTSNTITPTFPDGLDVEVMRFSCLERAWQEARMQTEREHVTFYIYSHPELFRLGSYKADVDYSNLRWTVDEPEDFQLIQTIYEELYPENPAFTSEDVLTLLTKRPEFKTINVKFRRNEGLEKSLREEDQTTKEG